MGGSSMSTITLVHLLAGGYAHARPTDDGTVRMTVDPASSGGRHSVSVSMALPREEARKLAAQLIDAADGEDA